MLPDGQDGVLESFSPARMRVFLSLQRLSFILEQRQLSCALDDSVTLKLLVYGTEVTPSQIGTVSVEEFVIWPLQGYSRLDKFEVAPE